VKAGDECGNLSGMEPPENPYRSPQAETSERQRKWHAQRRRRKLRGYAVATGYATAVFLVLCFLRLLVYLLNTWYFGGDFSRFPPFS